MLFIFIKTKFPKTLFDSKGHFAKKILILKFIRDNLYYSLNLWLDIYRLDIKNLHMSCKFWWLIIYFKEYKLTSDLNKIIVNV